MNCSVNERRSAQDPKQATSFMKHGGGGVIAWVCMTTTLVFIYIYSNMNSEVYRHHILSAQVQANTSKLTGWWFILQQGNDP